MLHAGAKDRNGPWGKEHIDRGHAHQFVDQETRGYRTMDTVVYGAETQITEHGKISAAATIDLFLRRAHVVEIKNGRYRANQQDERWPRNQRFALQFFIAVRNIAGLAQGGRHQKRISLVQLRT